MINVLHILTNLNGLKDRWKDGNDYIGDILENIFSSNFINIYIAHILNVVFVIRLVRKTKIIICSIWEWGNS